MRHIGFGPAWKSLGSGLVAAMMATLLLPAVCGATTIGLSPASTTINQGDVLTLSVEVNVSDDPVLYLFQFGVQYDASIFTPFAPQPGSLLDPLDPAFVFDAGCPFTCAAPPGTMALIAGFGSLTNPLATSGTLATLSFMAIASTTLPSLISLTTDGAGDGLVQYVVDPFDPNSTILFPLTITENTGALVTVNSSTGSTVPEPTTILLLGSGIAAALRKRQRFVGRRRPSGRPTEPV